MNKNKFRGSRLFRKYFNAFMAILLSSFAFLGSALMVFSMRYWTRDRLSRLSALTVQVAQEVNRIYAQSYGADGNRQEKLLAVLESDEVVFYLFNAEGRGVVYDGTAHETMLPSPVGSLRLSAQTAQRAMAGHYSTLGNPDSMFQELMMIAAEPFYIDGEAVGFVFAAQPLSGLFTYLAGILRLFLLSGLAVLILAFAVVYFITSRLVRPLNDMISATKRYAKGDFAYRVKTPERDDLRQLAEALNTMAIGLATLEGSRRSFVANVSHELKTPMTSIGGFIDGMLDGTIPAEEHRKYLGLVSGEVKRLARLVTGMLNLSRIEAGEMQLRHRPFDISELLFTTLLSFEQSIGRKQIELEGLDSLAPTVLLGDKDMLTQVFYNLIDNAVKFTPAGGRILLHARQEKDRFRVSLRNSGGGIASEELARIFERFYKTDKSRSYDTKGAGLGLYLAKTIVEMHGGEISAESDGSSWTKFAVELPLACEVNE